MILGQPASKANSRQLVTIKGRPAFIKSPEAREFERSALLQIPASAKRMLTGPVRATIRIFYASERPDLDESVVLDVLQARYETRCEQRVLVRKGVYLNDRQVREKHIFHGIDKSNPRAEVIIEPMTAQQEALL